MPATQSRPSEAGAKREKKQPIPGRLWDSLVHPTIRLPVEFPWGLKQFSKLYLMAIVYYLVGSLVPMMLIFGATTLAIHLWPEAMTSLAINGEGEPGMQYTLAVTIICFITGFGAELIYFNQQLKKAGLNLYRLLHLNLDSLNGSWAQAVKRSTYALLIALMAQRLLSGLPGVPHPHQDTADMAAGLQGGGLLVFAGLAALLAPFFEEVIFRGFLFGSLRKIFREGCLFSLIGSRSRLADYCAVTLSALMFALAHMDASAFLHLFVLGVILAELYRRSGSLICAMLLHAMNNLVAMLLIAGH